MEWTPVVISIIVAISGIIGARISAQAVIKTQSHVQKTEGDLNILRIANEATSIANKAKDDAKEAREENERILKAIGGKASFKDGYFSLDELIRNGEAPIYDLKVILKRDVAVTQKNLQ